MVLSPGVPSDILSSPQMENGSSWMSGVGSDRLEFGLKAAADKALHVLKAQQPVPKVLGGLEAGVRSRTLKVQKNSSFFFFVMRMTGVCIRMF